MNRFMKSCCSTDNGATLSPAWAPPVAVRGREFGSPLHAGAVWSAPAEPVLELEALREGHEVSRLSVERQLTWTPTLRENQENAPPRPVTPVTAGAGEWGPKAWASPKRGRTGSENDAGECRKGQRCRKNGSLTLFSPPHPGEPPRTLSLESPDLLSNAERVAASLGAFPASPGA
jgi:hypothetical protein